MAGRGLASVYYINLNVPGRIPEAELVFRALVHLFLITWEDFLNKILVQEKFSRINLMITRDGVQQETTIGDFFGRHSEFVEAGEPNKIMFGRSTSEIYTDEEELDLLFQVVKKHTTRNPVDNKGKDYWVFLKEKDTVTVTVTDIAEEWRRLTRLVYVPSP